MKSRITNCELRIWNIKRVSQILSSLLLSAVFVLAAGPCRAQRTFHSDPALFLEPNRFTLVKELQDRTLWLEMGFGKSVFHVGPVALGLEGLAWSRLEAISDFRFPVQTVDYFFGAYAMWGTPFDSWRLRVSHISSHLVDGTDTTIVGGASSRYSREFVELQRSMIFGGRSQFYATLAVRGYFHQVTRIESSVDVPASFVWRFASLDRLDNYNLYAFASSGAGPVWPCVSAGLRFEHRELSLAPLDLELYYQYGASWAGTDAGTKRSTINLQMDVRGF